MFLIQKHAFDASNIANATLHVPATSVDAYKAAEPWKNFKEIVGFIKGNVNGDDDIDIADAVHIVNYVVGKIQGLAPRFEMNMKEPE